MANNKIITRQILDTLLLGSQAKLKNEFSNLYAAFQEHSKTRKNLFITLLTAFGAVRNEHYLSVITQELTLDALFE